MDACQSRRPNCAHNVVAWAHPTYVFCILSCWIYFGSERGRLTAFTMVERHTPSGYGKRGKGKQGFVYEKAVQIECDSQLRG